MKYLSLSLAIALGVVVAAAQNPAPPPDASAQQQPSQIATTINGESGAPPRLAVPAFLALSSDAETVAAAKTISDVLWNDLNYEHEFTFVSRDIYATIPVAKSIDDPPFDRWREINADGLILGSVQKSGNGLMIRYRLFDVRSRRQVAGTEYSGSSNARRYAHTISDEIFAKQRDLKGVARTKIGFTSDRDGERLSGTIENRTVKEIYIADYDGENQQRVTVGRTLNAFPSWSPDGRSIAYVSWRRGQPNIFVSHIYDGTLDEITKGAGENYLPAWSPDGTRIAFASTRDGHSQIYVANRDGSNVRRLTNSPALDTTPTWSPKGNEIAFTSDRSGSPQIYVVGADGLGGVQRLTAESYVDRPTWSGETNEIAFESRTGARQFDIKVIDMNTRTVKQLTFGEGSNESPAFAPNGRHIVFMSDRTGKFQIYTMTRDGRDVRQLTKAGVNTLPSWSH
ncbi:MAG TPA: Tol-Pal system beta propeller repeat protein TolB [Vicinamibacterales bacterium]|nr:Tol-Pal system beta propeller repeat protein TolB [Vicinamibacterales bacterium]